MVHAARAPFLEAQRAHRGAQLTQHRILCLLVGHVRFLVACDRRGVALALSGAGAAEQRTGQEGFGEAASAGADAEGGAQGLRGRH